MRLKCYSQKIVYSRTLFILAYINIMYFSCCFQLACLTRFNKKFCHCTSVSFSTLIFNFRIFTKYPSCKILLTIAQLRPLDLYTHAQTYIKIAKLFCIDIIDLIRNHRVTLKIFVK